MQNRFQTQPEKYKKFLEILHTYQKDQKISKEGSGSLNSTKTLTEQEVYTQVAKLFGQDEDLLREFGQFLPDATNHQAQQFMTKSHNEHKRMANAAIATASTTMAGSLAGGSTHITMSTTTISGNTSITGGSVVGAVAGSGPLHLSSGATLTQIGNSAHATALGNLSAVNTSVSIKAYNNSNQQNHLLSGTGSVASGGIPPSSGISSTDMTYEKDYRSGSGTSSGVHINVPSSGGAGGTAGISHHISGNSNLRGGSYDTKDTHRLNHHSSSNSSSSPAVQIVNQKYLPHHHHHHHHHHHGAHNQSNQGAVLSSNSVIGGSSVTKKGIASGSIGSGSSISGGYGSTAHITASGITGVSGGVTGGVGQSHINSSNVNLPPHIGGSVTSNPNVGSLSYMPVQQNSYHSQIPAQSSSVPHVPGSGAARRHAIDNDSGSINAGNNMAGVAPSIAGSSNVLNAGVPPTKRHKSICRDVSFSEASRKCSIQDAAFFDKVRKALRSPEVYENFLRCLTLYTQEIVSKSELLTLVSPFLSKFPELLRWFTDFLGPQAQLNNSSCSIISSSGGAGSNTSGIQMESIPLQAAQRHHNVSSGSGNNMGSSASCSANNNSNDRQSNLQNNNSSGEYTQEIDLATCKRLGASYCALPPAAIPKTCSGRTELCKEVLNDQWVSFPTWASEDSTFVTSRKTQFEEAIYRLVHIISFYTNKAICREAIEVQHSYFIT